MLACMVISWIAGDMGTLLSFVCSGVFLLIIGITALLAAILLGKTSGKRDMKYTIGAIVLSCLFLAIGGKNLISAAIDFVEGPKVVYLRECTVTQTISLRRMFRSYHLEGIDSSGENKRFRVDKETYENYFGSGDFSIEILGWKRSGVIKEIY